jgi:hypothetical protein
MPPIRGVSWSSSDMNCGANVPTGVLFRAELDRSRAESLRPSNGLASCVRDWLRRWPIFGSVSKSGDETRADTGRPLGAGPPGGGDCVFLANGLLREFRANGLPPFGPGALIVAGGWCGCGLCYVLQARHALWKKRRAANKNGPARIECRIEYVQGCTSQGRREVDLVVTMVLQRGGCMRELLWGLFTRTPQQHSSPPPTLGAVRARDTCSSAISLEIEHRQ